VTLLLLNFPSSSWSRSHCEENIWEQRWQSATESDTSKPHLTLACKGHTAHTATENWKRLGLITSGRQHPWEATKQGTTHYSL
jgi:hypothetical protein